MHTLRTLAAGSAALLLLPVALPAQTVAYDITAERESTGLAFFDGEEFAGIVSIQYGAPSWKEEYDALVASDRSGSFRLGKDAWATLEAGLPLRFGETDVLAEHYGLALRRDAEGEFALLLIDFDKVRRERVLPIAPDALKPVAAVPLTYAKVDETADELTIRMQSSKSDARKGILTIHWGAHRLSTTWSAPRVHSRKQAFDASIAGMIALLDAKDYEELLRKYANPEFLAEHDVAEVAAAFGAEGSDKPETLRKVLAEVRSRNVAIGANQDQIHLEVEDAPGDEISFRYVDGRWCILDK